MLILRPVERRDLDELVALARRLDSVNLPAEPPLLEERIAGSERSFADLTGDWRRGLYVFVLEDTASGHVLGTSMLRAKHGTPDAPYYYLEVSTEERARRRASQRGYTLDSAEGQEILTDLRRRDHLDSTRETAPLRVADDAVIVNSDGREFADTVAEVVRIIKESAGGTTGA